MDDWSNPRNVEMQLPCLQRRLCISDMNQSSASSEYLLQIVFPFFVFKKNLFFRFTLFFPLLSFFLIQVDCHLGVNLFRVRNHLTKLFIADFAVSVHVGFQDCLIDNLLQLHLIQIVTHHHFQNLKQLPVANVSVSVHVVNLESKLELGFSVSLFAESGKSTNKLLRKLLR